MTNVKSFKINDIDSSISATGIVYDDSSTSLGATDIQTAIEKSYDKISNIIEDISTRMTTIDTDHESSIEYTVSATDSYIAATDCVRANRSVGDYAITQYISVSQGDIITITARGSNNGNVCLLGFKQSVEDVTVLSDIGTNVCDSVLVGSLNGDSEVTITETVTIEENGYIICSYKIAYGLVLTKYTHSILTLIKTDLSERQTVDSSILDRLSVLEDGEFTDLEYTVAVTDRYIHIENYIVKRTAGDYAITQYIPVSAGTYINVSACGSNSGTVAILGFKQIVDDVTVIPAAGENAIDECLVASTVSDKYTMTTAQVYIEEDGYIICSYLIAYGLTLQSGTPGLQTQIDTEIKTRQSSSTVSSRITTLESITEPFNESTPLNYECYDGGTLNIFETIAQIGDSLASGEMAYADATDESTTKYIDMYQHSWLSFIGRLTGRTVFNFSRSGASTTSFLAKATSFPSDYMDGANIFESFQTNLCQCYFVALGHNDRNAVVRSTEYTSASTSDEQLAILQAAVGTSADIVDVSTLDDNTTDTYYVRYAKVINEIKKIQPYAKIFPITMKTGQSSSSQWETEGWNDAIRYMAEIFTDVYIVDLGKYAPVIPSWHYTQGHGNAMGYSAYGKEVASYVNYIITNNRDYFKYTSFIGSSVQENAIPESTRISIGSSFE